MLVMGDMNALASESGVSIIEDVLGVGSETMVAATECGSAIKALRPIVRGTQAEAGISEHSSMLL